MVGALGEKHLEEGWGEGQAERKISAVGVKLVLLMDTVFFITGYGVVCRKSGIRRWNLPFLRCCMN